MEPAPRLSVFQCPSCPRPGPRLGLHVLLEYVFTQFRPQLHRGFGIVVTADEFGKIEMTAYQVKQIRIAARWFLRNDPRDASMDTPAELVDYPFAYIATALACCHYLLGIFGGRLSSGGSLRPSSRLSRDITTAQSLMIE